MCRVREVLRLIVNYYPDGHMEQEGTPKEIAQYQFALASLNTMQSFKKLLDAIPAEIEKQKTETAETVQEKPKRKSRSRKAADDDKT